MIGKFVKMHGLGNDFVIIDNRIDGRVGSRPELLKFTSARARAIADRNFGIGCDQLIVIETPAEPPAESDVNEAITEDFDMSIADTIAVQIFNADGSRAETCGNALRCLAVLLENHLVVVTSSGISAVRPLSEKRADGTLKKPNYAHALLCKPRFDWESIPMAQPPSVLSKRKRSEWQKFFPQHPPELIVNVGNPHIVFFFDDLRGTFIRTFGPLVERDPIFPERINVNLACVARHPTDGSPYIELETWERGTGLTQACGSGACATAIAAIRAGLCESPVTVAMAGGWVRVWWKEGDAIEMLGKADFVYEGSVDWSLFGFGDGGDGNDRDGDTSDSGA